jgi:K+-transporting ATPase ATPase A chain
MTTNGWLQIGLFFLVILLVTRPVGAWLFRVLEAPSGPQAQPTAFGGFLGRVEQGCYRLLGIDPAVEQTWVAYTFSLLAFSAIGVLGSYALLRLQDLLPLNPQKLAAVGPDLAWNTAVSFVTNTNWQSYSGESTMSNFSQMAALAWHNFMSAATGIAAALAVCRGFTRRPTAALAVVNGGQTSLAPPAAPRTLGNFWVDIVRCTLYVLLPASLVAALFFVQQGVPQTLAANLSVDTLEGVKQTIPLGPIASQEAIKMLGTNGGGFYNANSAHPFENPTPLSNLVQMLLIFVIPAGLTWTYGRMARDQKQGWALFAAMSLLFLAGVFVTYWAESHQNPTFAGLPLLPGGGNLEGKETRFGIAASSLFAVVTTDASCGAVNGMHDSFTPLGGLVPLVNIQLGELVFGGVGSGLYAILVYAVLTVFVAGLMVGRTPELLGKKIEGREMTLAMLYVLLYPVVVLGFSAWALVRPGSLAALNNAGPHGLSEILYAFTSAAGNNGSAFAGLSANTHFYNAMLGVSMLAGRFLMLIPALALAGSLVGKKVVPAGPGTFPTNGVLFSALLVGVIVIVGALTFFPALALGPVVEHFVAAQGQVF